MPKTRSCTPEKCQLTSQKGKGRQDHLAFRSDLQQSGFCEAAPASGGSNRGSADRGSALGGSNNRGSADRGSLSRGSNRGSADRGSKDYQRSGSQLDSAERGSKDYQESGSQSEFADRGSRGSQRSGSQLGSANRGSQDSQRSESKSGSTGVDGVTHDLESAIADSEAQETAAGTSDESESAPGGHQELPSDGQELDPDGHRVQFEKDKDSDDQISLELVTVNPVDQPTAARIAMMSESSGGKMNATQSGVVYYLQTVREPIVDYQETRGISRNEEITFVTLITSLCTQAYTAAITILVMLWNLMPLVDGFVYFFRFILDKVIDIIETEDTKERVIKALIFAAELIVTMFLIFLILGLIFMPVYVLLAQLTSKIFSMVAW